ncbi:MAG: amidohydrolase family protein [Gammaproteobacteria bacterium]|nr:amidohydrolase family protein [Gammaproteobacteria bacterium]
MDSPTNLEWLQGTDEDVLEPDLPICDPHHHLWEFRHQRVAHRYLLNEILADVNAGHNVVSTVFIECGAMYRTSGPEALRVVGETEFVNGIAAMSASGLYGPCRIAAGIVSTADLKLGAAVGDVLDAHIQAGGGRFRGIRHQGTWDADAEIGNGRNVSGAQEFSGAAFREGFAQLAPRKLSFEAWCYHPQIADVTALARAFPDTSIVLNHFGGPLGIGSYEGRQDEIYDDWVRSITELATCDNVVAKLGGINMELNGFGWHEKPAPPSSQVLTEATRRYYDTTVNLFGPERCMFESNFPVDMVSCSYRVLWNSFKRFAASYSPDEKAALFHDTAARVYRIEADAQGA